MSRAEPMKTKWSEEYDLATLATRGARRWDGRPNAVRHQQSAAPGRRRSCSGSRALVPRWDRDPLRGNRCRASLRARAWAHHERALVDVARRSALGFLRVRLDRPDPRLGAATTVGLFLAGQVIASIAIDHFGLLGVTAQPASIPRLLGGLLIIVGVAMVQRF